MRLERFCMDKSIQHLKEPNLKIIQMTIKYVKLLAVIGIVLLSNSIVTFTVSILYSNEYQITPLETIIILCYFLFVSGIILLFLCSLLFIFNWYFQHPYRTDKRS